MAEPSKVAASALRAFIEKTFTTVGMSADDAAAMADVFLWANLRGVDSHGVARVPRYVELFASGEANLNAEIRVDRPRPGVAFVSADHAPGPVALSKGMQCAIDIAREQGVGWVQVKETVHAGALGYYTELAANQGMIGLGFLAGMPNMAYPGARGAAVATSPFAVTVPAGDRAPFSLDMATAMIALGKINQYKMKGLQLPPDSAVTADGTPTTDPAEAKMPLPLGGIKGAGMSLGFELLTSVLAGVPIVAPFHGEGNKRHRQNAVLIAVDPAAFGDGGAYATAVAETLSAITGLTPLDEAAPVSVPGERGTRTAQARSDVGVPLPKGTWTALGEMAEKLGIELPERI
jgi:ureidoglycolate dehydrogenase (NAD+)